MIKHTQNEPAFPGGDWDPATTQASTPEKRKSGLTKLEYFAGELMKSALESAEVSDRTTPPELFTIAAKLAVTAAEALLAELDRRQT